MGGYSRVIPILLYNLPPEKWPEATQGVAGFAFHDTEGADEMGEPLDPQSREFRAKMRLVEELHGVLAALGRF